MPSEFEDTTVDELDVGNYSDEQLRDIVENDTRTTAQEKAQAELNRREADASNMTDDTTDDTPAEERQEAPVKDSAGYETAPLSEEAGAGQVQHALDQAQVSGTFPGDGNPPDASHTLAEVVKIPQHAEQESGTDPSENA